jgi:hypothetical protein
VAGWIPECGSGACGMRSWSTSRPGPCGALPAAPLTSAVAPRPLPSCPVLPEGRHLRKRGRGLRRCGLA